MRQEHVLAPDFWGRYSSRPIRMAVIGCGGNGSAILFGLPYLHHALQAWGHPDGLSVAVVDHDVVSATNCVRQPFGEADIGLNKAVVLINRVNLFHDLNWKATPAMFTRNLAIDEPFRGIDLVISCVDTKKARAEIHAALTGASSPWGLTRYWLDLGNSSDRGQFVLGQPLNQANPRRRDRLHTITEIFPAITDTTTAEDDLPSCSAAEALERQEPFVNNVLATSALAMLAHLFRYGRISYHGGFYSAQNGRLASLAPDPDAWEKQQRRRKRARQRCA